MEQTRREAGTASVIRPSGLREAAALWKSLAFADKVNLIVAIASIVSLLVGVVSIFIAVQAYWDAHDSGISQTKLLTAAGNSLSSEVGVAKEQQSVLKQSLASAQKYIVTLKQSSKKEAELLTSAETSLQREVAISSAQQTELLQQQRILRRQQQVLEGNLKVASAQLALLQQQSDRALALARRRPNITFSVPTTLGDVPLSHPNLSCELNPQGWCRITITLHNGGDAALREAHVLLQAQPSTVFVDSAGFRLGTAVNHNVWSATFDAIEPYSSVHSNYSVVVDVTPNGAMTFAINIRVIGSGSSSDSYGGSWTGTLLLKTQPAGP